MLCTKWGVRFGLCVRFQTPEETKHEAAMWYKVTDAYDMEGAPPSQNNFPRGYREIVGFLGRSLSENGVADSVQMSTKVCALSREWGILPVDVYSTGK